MYFNFATTFMSAMLVIFVGVSSTAGATEVKMQPSSTGAAGENFVIGVWPEQPSFADVATPKKGNTGKATQGRPTRTARFRAYSVWL